ncbi:MAG: hypothetical protein JWL79_866 [Frankiales bacterium]|jgi:hypothetical protein|nr:hypothetical protein [Frankiales bacterium]
MLQVSLRSVLIDTNNPTSASSKARAKRWERFNASFPDLASARVLDLGGTPAYWRTAPIRPAAVTTVNLTAPDVAEPWITTVAADACTYDGTGFDLVVSNSLLEHLGGAARRQQFSKVVHTAAPRFWIQTPYRYFPVEPHWLFPGFQFLPLAARVAVTRRWKHGHCYQPDPRKALKLVLEVELVGATEMSALFPDAELWRERAGGLTKSLVSIRS